MLQSSKVANLNLPLVPVTASLVMEEQFFLTIPLEARIEVFSIVTMMLCRLQQSGNKSQDPVENHP